MIFNIFFFSLPAYLSNQADRNLLWVQQVLQYQHVQDYPLYQADHQDQPDLDLPWVQENHQVQADQVSQRLP